MNNLFGGTKDKKFLFFAVATSVILVGAVFLFFDLGEKERTEYLGQIAPKEKTMEEIIQSFSAFPKPGEKPTPVSGEIRESFSAVPAGPSAGPKKNKTAQPTPAPTAASVPEDILESFSAQTLKK